MKKVIVNYKVLEGTNYEIGKELARGVLQDKTLMTKSLLPPMAYPLDKLNEIMKLIDDYMPGMNDEIRGFAEVLNISLEQVIFYAMSYLERGCSLMAALPKKTMDGHTLMARNYDFNDEMEEMWFAKTKVRGKYAHIGDTLNLFGRCDGINEHGLAVCKASNGLPVGNFEGGQKAGVTGVQFWIVVRSLLENCKDVKEAIDLAMKMPIGYNINLMVADHNNVIALLQCIDGHKTYKILDKKSEETFLSVTNHVILPELKPFEKMLIKNSVIRNDCIQNLFKQKDKVSKEDLKKLLSTSYPEGLCCHYYEEFFGTLRSMIFDTTNKTIEMSFGTPQYNEWHVFRLSDTLEESKYEVTLPYEKASTSFYDIEMKK